MRSPLVRGRRRRRRLARLGGLEGRDAGRAAARHQHVDVIGAWGLGGGGAGMCE
jgi:hypothetical protein